MTKKEVKIGNVVFEQKTGEPRITINLYTTTPCIIEFLRHDDHLTALVITEKLQVSASGAVESTCYTITARDLLENQDLCTTPVTRFDLSVPNYPDLTNLRFVTTYTCNNPDCTILQAFFTLMKSYGEEGYLDRYTREKYEGLPGKESFEKLNRLVREYWKIK